MSYPFEDDRYDPIHDAVEPPSPDEYEDLNRPLPRKLVERHPSPVCDADFLRGVNLAYQDYPF